MRTYNRPFRSLLLALILILGLACRFALPTPRMSPTPEPEAKASATEPAPTESPETDTPAPTPTYEPEYPLPAPRLMLRSPEPREKLGLDAPIELVFDQPMDQESVTQAFSLEPKVEGTFNWVNDHIVRFEPAVTLSRESQYEVVIDNSARNIEGEPMLEPVTFDFETVGYLEVSEVQPGPGSVGVDPETLVTVVFNRPVVPLTGVEQQSDLPDPLSFDPPVEGEGAWLSTSIYQFKPEPALQPATAYTARISGEINDTLGAPLEDRYAWTFTTVPPTMIAWSPRSRADHVGPSEVISVTFNQPMDRASVEAAFSLRVNDRSIQGSFAWRGGDSIVDPESMIFTPDDPLPRNATGQVVIDMSAHARDSQVSLAQAVGWDFDTVRSPGIVSTAPTNGETDVSPYRDVVITFASPMTTDATLDYVTISPEPTEVYTYWSDADTELRIAFPKEPATQINVQLDGSMPDRYGEPLGETLNLTFNTGDLPPRADLQTENRIGTFNAYTETILYTRYQNVSRLDFTLYRLSLGDFMELHGYASYRERQDFEPRSADRIRQWSLPLDAPRNETRLAKAVMTNAAGDSLPPGIYFLEVSAPELLEKDPDRRPTRYTFVRSYINLVLKRTQTESMVWATDLESGEPVAGEPVRMHAESRGWHARGQTDKDGLWIATGLDAISVWDEMFAFMGEPGSDIFSVAISTWDNGISPWDFGLNSDFSDTGYIGHLYTDRPIYRPEQTVYFKGIVRADDDAHYTIPQEMKALEILIDDPQGNELYRETLDVSDMGTFHGQLTLDAEAPLGTYYIRINGERWDFYAGTGFRVAEYRAPEFEVAVETDRDHYLHGDKINVTVDADYYFGGPVANAQLEWNVLSTEHFFRYQCPAGTTCPRYSWTDYEWNTDYGEQYGSYGRLIAQGETQTDDEGRATFVVSADIAEEIQSRRFTVEANITDLNNQVVSQRTSAIVHKGEFYIGIASEGRLAEADEIVTMNLLTVDWESEPVADVEMDVVVMEHRWYSVREQAANGRAYWTWTSEDVPVYTTTVTTDDEGKARTTFVPESSGTYRVRAIAEDNEDNTIRSSTYVWVWGGGTARWRRESTNRIDLIVDRESYSVGDVAEILIPSPYSGTTHALITLERGHILETEVRRLTSNTEVLEIPITEDHVPNLFVSIVLIQGMDAAPDGIAGFKMGQVMLSVATETKALNINLTPDRDMEAGETYQPQETAVYDVEVTDDQGRPVEAELSLRLADRAVLALAEDTGPTLMERFWRERGLAVRTTTALAVAMEPFNRELAPEAKGGGGGGGEAAPYIRTQFADTAFWDPVVRTDPDGKARVEVKLPDNLTVWRMQARGITAETQVGRAEVDIRSTLDLLVRPVLPRFFVVGDRAEIATIVNNNTGQTLSTNVKLTVNGLELEGADTQQVRVPAGDQVKVTWSVRVQTVDEVSVQMEAQAGDLVDGRRDVLPVYSISTPEVIATAGRLSEPGIRQEIVQIPPSADPDQGELTVQLDGSLTAATKDALDYLEHYPYECIEQTVSRFLPNVLTYQALTEMGLDRPELARNLDTQVNLALQRITNEQHYDGGWGWWMTNESNPYITAYVIHGILEAYRAGYSVDLDVLENGVRYLQETINTADPDLTHWEANRLAYELYVLAEYLRLVPDAESRGELGRAINLYENRRQLDQTGKAMLVVALGLLEPEEDLRIKTLLSDLTGDAIYSATGTHWEEARIDYYNMNTDIRTTATVLWAMAHHRPESELLPSTVRWLMSVRKGGYWESTHTTAWSLIALTRYMQASGELEGDFSYTVSLNGQTLLEDAVTPETLDEGEQLTIELTQLMVDRANRLIIERHSPAEDERGEGQLYYTAHLRTFVPAQEVDAVDRGIVVARQYTLLDDPEGVTTEAEVGDVIRVKLTVIAPTNLHYVLVEDPLPAGCEAVDVTLRTTSVVGMRPTIERVSPEEEMRRNRWYGWGWWWFSHAEMRDEKVTLFSTYLPRGTYEYSYIIRASVPGAYNVIPATAAQMYFPEVFGRSAGTTFTVEE
jgi:alpha-2-macroglobulin